MLEGAAEVMTNEGHGPGEAEEGAMVVRAENWMRFEWRGSMAVGERVFDSPQRVRVSGVPPIYMVIIRQGIAVRKSLATNPGELGPDHVLNSVRSAASGGRSALSE